MPSISGAVAAPRKGRAATSRKIVKECTAMPSRAGEPGACAPGQFQAEPGEHARQRHAPPAVPAGQPVGLHRRT